MVDVFEIAPQDPMARANTTPFAYAGQGPRLARYQHLVSKLSTDEEAAQDGVKVDWLTEHDPIELSRDQAASTKSLDDNDTPLVGTFADAAAAMK